jgi:hypothetical protein
MTIMNGSKRLWKNKILVPAFLLVLAVSLPLIAKTGFESPYHHPGRLLDAKSDIEKGWFFGDQVIRRQSAPGPYPDTLILVGSYETPGKARDVWVDYPLAYLASDHIGVEVIDVSDPANPILINTIDTPGQAFDVMALDTLLYAADDYSGFQILDGTGIVGGYDTPRISRGLFVQAPYVYVADYESLLVFDAADPTAPVLVGSLMFGELEGSAATSIFVSGSHAYVGDPMPGTHLMLIIDISNPADPQWVGWYNDMEYLLSPRNIYVAGNVAYIANYWNGLFMVDVSNPGSTSRISFIVPPTPSGFAWDVKLRDISAYVAIYDNGLWVVDVSDPAYPQTRAVYDTPGLASGIFVDSSHIYVADYYSLLIFEQEPNGVEEAGNTRTNSDATVLFQNRPNPFHTRTGISYQIPCSQSITLRIYDISGRLANTLVEGEVSPGIHEAHWSGSDESGRPAPPGVYFCRLETVSESCVRQMVLVK